MLVKLIQYMKARAKFEKVKWDLTEKDLMMYFNEGIRNFFGVIVDNKGNLVEDTEQPSFFLSQKWNSLN